MQTIKRKTQNKHLQLLNNNHFTLYHRLKARIGISNLGNGVYLGYCKNHRRYYLDYKHTNDEIRCPFCDQKWLSKKGI